MSTHRVQCVTCGFLARRGTQPWGGKRDWFEVYPEQRIDPALAMEVPLGFDNRNIPADIVCFRFAEVFPGRHLDNAVLRSNANEARGALIEYRACRAWCDYNPGHDPKDHMNELRLRLIERTQNRLALIAIIAAAIFGLAQIAASVITAGPDSWIREVVGKPKPTQPPSPALPE